MYIPSDKRAPQFEFIIEALRKGMVIGVTHRDKSEISYVLLRAATRAWIDLGGGYNNGSDIKAILNDVTDEFTAKVTHSLKGKKEKYGDVDQPINLPDTDKLTAKKTEPTIIDKDGKTLESKEKSGEKSI